MASKKKLAKSYLSDFQNYFLFNDALGCSYIIHKSSPILEIVRKKQEENGFVEKRFFEYDEFTVGELVMAVDQFIRSMNTGIPGQPSGSEFHEFSFPSSFANLELSEIGDWIAKMAGWESYWLSSSARIEGEYVALRESFEIGIFRFAEEKMTVKAVEYAATQKDENMRKMKQRIIKLKAELAAADRIIASFKILREALSRELSRRELESRV